MMIKERTSYYKGYTTHQCPMQRIVCRIMPTSDLNPKKPQEDCKLYTVIARLGLKTYIKLHDEVACGIVMSRRLRYTRDGALIRKKSRPQAEVLDAPLTTTQETERLCKDRH
jgi:hypothetical protein